MRYDVAITHLESGHTMVAYSLSQRMLEQWETDEYLIDVICMHQEEDDEAQNEDQVD